MKNIFFRFACFLTFFVLVFFLAGCSGSTQEPIKESSEETRGELTANADHVETAVMSRSEDTDEEPGPESASELIERTGGETERNVPVFEEKPKICIDPGHYAGINHTPDYVEYEYIEGDFTLKVGLRLKEILEERYGIECCLTRTAEHITLGGYTDEVLDREHTMLRGTWAAEMGCDFFFSIHTNANPDNANGYPTFYQPIDITKTVVLANIPCCRSEKWLRVANEIGETLSRVNYEAGIASRPDFRRGSVGDIPEWSDEWNDSTTLPGAVLARYWEGKDYYGVLRGAAEYGVPGIIVEHAFHTVPEMRYQASYGDLAEKWAQADASAIAYALGIKGNY